MSDARWLQASRLMDAFARDTGLIGGRPPRRYLWTDAHAVCNWLELEHRLGDQRYFRLAAALVDQVHEVLGRHRNDDARSGWISDLEEAQGEQHPTVGGLRIGKPYPQRREDEPQDPQAEWQQDGQYYHYLTKWMHALYKMARSRGDPDYQRWAVELALATHRGFRARKGSPRLFWKMSIELTYPLVASSGHHDPLDGLISCLVLRGNQAQPSLDDVIADLGELCRDRSWLTDDPLAIGGLLFDAGRLAQLQQTSPDSNLTDLLIDLLEDAAGSLTHFRAAGALQAPASRRLAFRELGLAIGLQVFELIRSCDPDHRVLQALDRLRPFLALTRLIEEFWLQPQHTQTATWTDHEDINAVMLATSLTAPGFLSI